VQSNVNRHFDIDVSLLFSRGCVLSKYLSEFFSMDAEHIKQRIDTAIELLQKLRSEIDAGQPKLPPHAQELYDKGICLFCKVGFEDGEKPHRGVHEHEHRKMLRRIEKGEVTEVELIKMGLLAPAKPAGRKSMSVFEEAKKVSEEKAKLQTEKPNENLGMVAENIDNFSTTIGRSTAKSTVTKKSVSKKKGSA
jgi:hypothetical protein